MRAGSASQSERFSKTTGHLYSCRGGYLRRRTPQVSRKHDRQSTTSMCGRPEANECSTENIGGSFFLS